jgi:hypothetical protein
MHPGIRIVVICGLTVACGPVLAQTTDKKPTAAQQLSTANQGTAARNHVFDGSKPPPSPVTANPAPKPSVVGVPASEFKPTVHLAPAKPPPAPPRNLNPTGDAAVQRGINSYKKPGT